MSLFYTIDKLNYKTLEAILELKIFRKSFYSSNHLTQHLVNTLQKNLISTILMYCASTKYK
jgi:hypothetical protein